jgi:hypothetical protein
MTNPVTLILVLFMYLLSIRPSISEEEAPYLIPASQEISIIAQNRTCAPHHQTQGMSATCFTRHCGRFIRDGLFSVEEVTSLRAIAEKGMSNRIPAGGPTILDINTGYIRDTYGLQNLFENATTTGEFTEGDFGRYGFIINKLKTVLESSFAIDSLYFTAPTFITRLDGRAEWEPQEIHDEYWHSHIDRNNTPHYHYSGLLYMSTYLEEFTGGRLVFLDDAEEPELIVEPRAGRVALFTSGENLHRVERVTSGTRFVLAFWFTCDQRREFEIFLDGKKHIQFGKKVRDSILQKRSKRKQDL